MGKQYMDYGLIISRDTYTIPKNLTLIDYNKKGLVYRLTHDGEGKSLSFMNKAFISFTYGDRKILDFGFIATTVNNRLDRLNAPDSEDYTTEYKMLHGQYYWGSHYQAREIVITLATDGVTQKQLDDFKYWFQPGEIRELILSLHPNRAILARVQGRPEISVLPFKRTERIFINDDWQEIEIIEYKGEAQINFVMDLPFWYAKHNILGNLIEDDYGNYVLADSWIDSNGNIVDILDADARKVALEDKIPTSSMINYLVIYADTMQLLPYNIYKYTLDEEKKILAKNEIGLLIVGAPLANDELDIKYPFSGAVVGILYKPIYKEGSRITHISKAHIKLGYMFSNIDGTIKVRDYMDGLMPKRDLITVDYIPIKAGSTINYISDKLDGMVIIQKYTIADENEYNYKLEEQIALSYFDNEFIAEENTIIRISVSIESDHWDDEIDGVFLLSKFIKLSLIPFESTLQGYNLDKNNNLYYFYSGNAVSHPKITFSVPIHFNNEGYIDSFSSENLLHLNLKPYNTFKLESLFIHELKITNPSIFDSYNMVIKKLKEEQEQDLPSFVQELRNTITHPAVRNWIINCINIYYNNFDMEAMMIDTSVKLQLLQYMPYLFVSFKDAEILIKEDLPETVKESFQTLYKTEIVRWDNLSIRMPITENGKILVSEGSNFKVKINTYLDSNTIINSNLSLYYQWQYSDKNDPNKWYLIFDDYNEEENTGKWSGATDQILEGHGIDENDFGIKLRCIVSNNSNYQLDQLIQIEEYDNTISMSPKQNLLNINQNSKGTLTWEIDGQYLRGNTPDIQQYIPKIYYQPNGSGNWVPYDSTNNNYNGQIINGKLSKNDALVTFEFTAKENDQRKLRDTKFKLVIYPLDAQEIITASELENDTNFPPISIGITRLEVSNPTITFTATYNGVVTEILSNNDIKNDQGYRLGTQLKLLITGIQNINSNSNKNSTTYLLLGNNLNGNITWDKLRADYDSLITKTISSTKIIFEWTLNEAWNEQLSLIRIVTENYEETKYFLNNSNFRIFQLSNDALNNDIDSYNPELSKYQTGYKQQLYEQIDKLSLTIQHGNTIPATDNYYIIYNWYYMENLINNEFDFSQATKLSSASKIYTNELVRSCTLEINKNNVTINTKGYYKCQVIIKVEKISWSNLNERYVIKDISPTNYIFIDVIKQISITNPTCNIQGWTYYTGSELMDNANKVPVTFPQTLSLSYKINNYNINNVVKWYYIKNGKSSLLKTDTNISNNITTYSTSCPSAKTLYEWKDYQYYCLVYDNYNTKYTSSYIQLSFITKNNRFIDIDISQIKQNVDISWNWPVIDLQNSRPTDNSTIIILKQHYKMIWDNKNKKLELSGTPQTNFISSKTTINAANAEAARNDGYFSNVPLGTLSTSLSTLLGYSYNGYNASYETILLFNSNNYDEIKLIANVAIPQSSKFKYYYRVIQGETIHINETELTSTTKTITINLNLENSTISNNIEFQIKVYYPSKWPTNIGSLKNPLSTLSNYKFNVNNFPVLSTNPTITFTTLQGKEKSSRMLNTFLRNSRLLQNNIVYLPPIISQTCPISLNCATGEYYMQVVYNTLDWPNGILPEEEEDSNKYNPKLICYLSSLRKGLSHIKTESIGNAILYNNLLFILQNHFDPITNKVKIWSNTDKTLCHKLSYDGDIPLLRFNILYKNLYL